MCTMWLYYGFDETISVAIFGSSNLGLGRRRANLLATGRAMAYVNTPKPSRLAGPLPPTTRPPAHVLEKHQPHGPGAPWTPCLVAPKKKRKLSGPLTAAFKKPRFASPKKEVPKKPEHEKFEKHQPAGPPTIRARLEYALDMHGSGLPALDLMRLWIQRQANDQMQQLFF